MKYLIPLLAVLLMCNPADAKGHSLGGNLAKDSNAVFFDGTTYYTMNGKEIIKLPEGVRIIPFGQMPEKIAEIEVADGKNFVIDERGILHDKNDEKEERLATAEKALSMIADILQCYSERISDLESQLYDIKKRLGPSPLVIPPSVTLTGGKGHG